MANYMASRRIIKAAKEPNLYKNRPKDFWGRKVKKGAWYCLSVTFKTKKKADDWGLKCYKEFLEKLRLKKQRAFEERVRRDFKNNLNDQSIDHHIERTVRRVEGRKQFVNVPMPVLFKTDIVIDSLLDTLTTDDLINQLYRRAEIKGKNQLMVKLRPFTTDQDEDFE